MTFQPFIINWLSIHLNTLSTFQLAQSDLPRVRSSDDVLYILILSDRNLLFIGFIVFGNLKFVQLFNNLV